MGRDSFSQIEQHLKQFIAQQSQPVTLSSQPRPLTTEPTLSKTTSSGFPSVDKTTSCPSSTIESDTNSTVTSTIMTQHTQGEWRIFLFPYFDSLFRGFAEHH
jgi:hypothetical protein